MPKKIKKSRKVQKMLSPEEMTLVSNIESLLSELMQMGAGAGMEPEVAPETPDMVMEAEDMPMDEEEKGIKKGLEETPSESATASDGAEERMEEPMTELSTENLSDVEKAILGMIRNQGVNKSVKTEQSPLTQVLNKMVEIQKSSQDKINDLSTAVENILGGLGVAKQLEVVQEQTNRDPKTINKSQNDELIAALQSIVEVKKEKKPVGPRSQQNEVRKNLNNYDTLRGMIGY